MWYVNYCVLFQSGKCSYGKNEFAWKKKNPQIVSFHAGVSFKTRFLHDACQEKSAVLCVSEVLKAI